MISAEKRKELRAAVLAKANYCCEHCDAVNYSIVQRPIRKNCTVTRALKITLTIAQLDRNAQNFELSNLIALCQKCWAAHEADLRVTIYHPNAVFGGGINAC